MTNAQLYLVIGVPILANAALMGVVWAYLHTKFENINRQFDLIDGHFDSIDRRFDAMRAL